MGLHIVVNQSSCLLYAHMKRAMSTTIISLMLLNQQITMLHHVHGHHVVTPCHLPICINWFSLTCNQLACPCHILHVLHIWEIVLHHIRKQSEVHVQMLFVYIKMCFQVITTSGEEIWVIYYTLSKVKGSVLRLIRPAYGQFPFA